MEFQGFTLDKFQEESVRGVEGNHSVLVSAPTGSGKTLIADYIIDKFLNGDKRIIYTAPIKALSNQKFKDFREQYGEDRIGMITGDVVINSDAQILIMTTEVYRNMAIIKDPLLEDVAYCIMDEIHYISDEERGYIWEESIIFSPEHVRFLFLSATIPNSEEFGGWVESIKKHKVVLIKHNIRPVPLERKFYDVDLGITSLDQIKDRKELDQYPRERRGKRGKYFKRNSAPAPDYRDLVHELSDKSALPCIYFVFSRAKTQEYAVKLANKKPFLSPEEQKEVLAEMSAEFRKINPEILALQSARDLKSCIPKGIAFHNAGLLPDLKHVVEHLFGKGLIKVLFATETFAVGINMPAKTVCFDSLRKFTGAGFRNLNSKEYFQISGRAGRRGIDKKGLSVAVIHRPSAELEKIAEFTKEDKLPLKSQFQLTYNTVLNMVHRHSEDEIQTLLKMNFFTFQKMRGRTEKTRVLATIKARYTKIIKTLRKLGYVEEGHALTEKGIFCSKIFSEELEITEIFKGDMPYNLDEYAILLLLAALTYEGRRGARFYQMFNQKLNSKIISAVQNNPGLKKGTWVGNIQRLSSIIDPCFKGKKFTEVLKNTNLLEGDLIRIFMRILDKLEQIDKALEYDDDGLQHTVRNCKHIIKDCLEGIHVF